MRRFLAGALLALPGTAHADALQERVLAGIRATDTRDVAFTRTTRVERTGGEPSTYVNRYDPRATPRWALVSVDGKAPKAKEQAQAAKERDPAAGYTGLAKWFAGPATRSDGPNGTVIYRFARLPAGVFKMGKHDASADTSAEAVVEPGGPRPWVRRVRLVTTKPVRMMLVAKLERMTADSSYRLLPDGRVFPQAVSVDIAGSLMGKSGTMATRTTFAVR